MHLHAVHLERETTVTVERAREVMNGQTRPRLPAAETDGIRSPSIDWLPAASTSRQALADPQGWYQRTLVAEQRAAAGVKVIQLAVDNLSPGERRQTHAFTRHTLQRNVNRVRPFSLPA